MPNNHGSMEIDTETEIDLWQLLANGWKFFKRRAGIILSFFLIGLLYSISNFFTQPDDYRSFYRQEFIAHSSVTTDAILSDIINAIPVNVMNTPDSAFPEFRTIKAKLEANRNKETRLKLILETFDTAGVHSLLGAVGSRVGSIDVLKKDHDFTTLQYKKLLKEITKQLSGNDSAKVSSGNPNSIDLMEKKQGVEKLLAGNTIIAFLPINDRPVAVSNSRAGVLNVLGWTFLGLVLGAAVAGLLDLLNRKK